MQYTKGEWKVTGKSPYAYAGINVRAANGSLREDVAIIYHENDDAHLIAAAPDMYQALKTVIDSTSKIPAKDAVLMARKALAKAEGEE